MTTPSEDGIVFRTDANLRPEGREGPLTRTLDSYTTYWDGWARTWEFQALIKARPVAGEPDLGARFMRVGDASGCGPRSSTPTRSARSAR